MAAITTLPDPVAVITATEKLSDLSASTRKVPPLSSSDRDINSDSESDHYTPATSPGLASAVTTIPQRIPTYPKTRISIVDRFIDQPRALKVAVIGGGLAGITAGILLPAKVPSIQLTIFEKNDDFGGTWLENTYPGIRDYWQSVAKKHDVYRLARFETRVQSLEWDAGKSVWKVSTQHKQEAQSKVEEFDFVLNAIGRFNAWKLPDYEGIESYKGHLRHASHWDEEFDVDGKTVAVIGNGASGIQLVANLQKRVKQLDHYARNKTWIAGSWAGDERTAGPQPYSEEQKELFARDPEAYLKFRKELEDKYWRRFSAFFRGSETNIDLREKFIEIMKQRLKKKPELLEHIVPDFSPNCRRLTPGPGYLEAISEDNVEYIASRIARFTEDGIVTIDGKERKVDADGTELKELWDPESKTGHSFPYTYLGLATPGFPNLLFVHGPHGTGPSGTVPHSVEVQLVCFAKILRKVAREGIKSIQPSKKAADEFVEYSDAFFASTVLSDNCSSWYNGGRPGGRIHGIWPGSAGHVTAVRREPRWEDWEYTYLGPEGNRFAWYFGNGWTRKEADENSDMTSYLRLPGEVSLKDIHESWWDLP
ncbi:hypothetical protein QBC40DRAFT_269199 [Triangularia verruculosa]|uniref:Uncharacterized protein n=1 Tax=Triangularia verruculosa TaxID=2587418 RepID=A0AAN7ANQ2_9PEZI|nr:hypothetical protein QBC40DRAFT_269199 [Triangularia verruculosa]